MKIKLNICLLCFFLITTLQAANNPTDVRGLFSGVPNNTRDFIIRVPLDDESGEHGWRYAIRYVHHEPEAELSFSVTLVRSSEDRLFYLALYENMSADTDFTKMDDLEKLKTAGSKKSVDIPLAQEIYKKIIGFLLNTRYGHAYKSDGNPQYFYISAFSLETGYMCATTSDYKGSKKSKHVGDLGKLVRKYIINTDAKEEDKIKKKIYELLKQF
jgi:hypothetical protein